MVTNQEQVVSDSFRLHDADTGSVEVQIASLTGRISQLTEHCKLNPKDFSSRRGLLKLVGRRRSFLRYIKEKDEQKYQNIVERLELRK